MNVLHCQSIIYVHAYSIHTITAPVLSIPQPTHPTRGAMSQSTSPRGCARACVCVEGEKVDVQTTCSRVILVGLSAEQRHNKHLRNRKSLPGGVTITTEITSAYPTRRTSSVCSHVSEQGGGLLQQRLDLIDGAVGVVGCDGVWRLASGSLRRLRMVST